MGKLFKGLLAAAALAWCGSAQAAYVNFTVEVEGYGTYGQFDSHGQWQEWSGTAIGTVKFSIMEGWFDDASGSVTSSSLSFNVIDPNPWENHYANGSAVLAEGTFPNGAALLAGVITPISGIASLDWGSQYEGGEMTGRITSIVTELSDIGFGDGFGQISGIVFGGPSGVPEPASWAMMLTGFGLLGQALRRDRRGQIKPSCDSI